MTSWSDITEYALLAAATRLEDFSSAARAVVERPDEEAVHDLRIAVRRLSGSLSVFAALLPDTRRVRKRLRKIRASAGELRDRDVALEFLRDAKLPRSDLLAKRLLADRQRAEARLRKSILRWLNSGQEGEWRSLLTPQRRENS